MIELSSIDNTEFLKARRSTLTGTAKWKDIEDLINRWARRNPKAAIENEQWVKEANSGLSDKKFGNSKEKAMGRLGVSIHPELMNYIQAFYPDFMDTKKDMHEFMRRFKKFRVPDKT